MTHGDPISVCALIFCAREPVAFPKSVNTWCTFEYTRSTLANVKSLRIAESLYAFFKEYLIISQITSKYNVQYVPSIDLFAFSRLIYNYFYCITFIVNIIRKIKYRVYTRKLLIFFLLNLLLNISVIKIAINVFRIRDIYFSFIFFGNIDRRDWTKMQGDQRVVIAVYTCRAGCIYRAVCRDRVDINVHFLLLFRHASPGWLTRDQPPVVGQFLARINIKFHGPRAHEIGRSAFRRSQI